MVTHKRLLELLDYDPKTGLFTRKISRSGPNSHVGAVAGCDNGQGYIRIYLDGKPYKAHRLAWLYFYGKWPEGEIDHANGARSENWINNLRDVDRLQNTMNRKRNENNSAGAKGVSFYKRTQKWKAQIQVRGKKMGLGYFLTKEEAAAAYKNAAIEHFGEFARTG